MNATTDDGDDRRPLFALIQLSEAEAKDELSYHEYQRWKSATDHRDQYNERVDEWQQNEADATSDLVRSDVSSLTVEVDLFGNAVDVYYDPEDPRFRDAADELGDILGVDMAGEDIEASADDVSDEQLEAAKRALADLICVTVQTWEGHRWDELDIGTRGDIRVQIAEPRPTGWGLAGLMDALSEIMTAVETNRNDRLERVQKFRNPEWRGNR